MLSAETASAPIESSTEFALAGDIAAVAGVLRDLVANVSNPASLSELVPVLERYVNAVTVQVAGLGDVADLDGAALADRTQALLPPELRAVVGQRLLEGDML